MSLKTHQSRKRMLSSGQMQQQRYSDQEDSAFQSSQCYGGSQMMNSQENSQNGSFDLFSQLQQNSQHNENVPSSHRFYTKYMSKAPLFPRESSQSERNPLPRRRSFQDVQEYNRQKAKERDDRDLINTFIALVKECADEVKNAADDIKNSVDKNMKDSASQSATLMKKLNDDLSEHYNTLLDSIKEKETEQDKVAELEQALAAKEARIEVLESQLEAANKTKEEKVIQSVVDAYAQQQQLNREHLNKIQDEQQQFTKEQVEIINQKHQDQLTKHQDQLKKHQDELEKSFLVEYSEKQSAKSMDTNKDTSTETATLSAIQPRPTSTSLCHQQPSSVVDNQAPHFGVAPVPSAQPQQTNFVQLTASQKSICPLPVNNYQTCNINSRCCYNEFEYPIPNTGAVPFQPASIPISTSFPTYNNVSQSLNNQHVHPQPERNNTTQLQYLPQQTRSNVSQCIQQPAPTTRALLPVSRSINSSDIALLSMTSPITDNPTAVLWSRANRLGPSPVATVAPQVKREHHSPPEQSEDGSQVEDFSQQSSLVQQRRSTRGGNAMKRQTNESQSRRSSARVQARTQPLTDKQQPAKLKSRQNKNGRVQQNKQKQQQQVYQQRRLPTQQPDMKANKKNVAAQRKRKQEKALDVYEFEDENRFKPAEVATNKRMKKNTGANQLIQPSYPKQKITQNDAQRSYPDWVTKSKSVTRKPSQLSHQWIVQDDQSTDDEYDFNDSQGIDESPQEQIVPQKRFGNTYKSNSGKSVQRYQSSKPSNPKSNFLSYSDDEESSEEITFSLESPEYVTGKAVYRQQKQETPIVTDDFLSTPCLQTVEYDSSEDSQLVTGFMSAPGSALQRKVSRQVERKRRLQSVARQVDVNHTLAKISRSISKQRQRMKRSGTLI